MTSTNGNKTAAVTPEVATAPASNVPVASTQSPLSPADLASLDYHGLGAAVKAGQVSRDAANAEWQRRSREHDEQLARNEAAYKADRHARAVAYHWEHCDPPARHAGKVDQLRKLTRGAWAEVLRLWRERIAEGFLIALVGPRGVGKTQLAVCLLRDAAELGPALYVKAADIGRQIRETFQKDSDRSEAQAVAAFVHPRLLVIDEVQEVAGTDFDCRTLSDIVDRRYAAMLSTLLISNLTPSAFAETMGSSIMSRMTECGELIECVWPSFRGKVGDSDA